MKKTLLFLLFSIITFGQNLELLKNINKSDSLYTRELSERIFDGYKILPERNVDKEISKRFDSAEIKYTLKKAATEKDIIDYVEGKGCKDCVNIEFSIRNGDSKLNANGAKYYIFKEARGSFLNMFPFWKKDIEPQATTDKTNDKYPLYNYKNVEDKVWLVLRPTNSYWIIRNMNSNY